MRLVADIKARLQGTLMEVPECAGCDLLFEDRRIYNCVGDTAGNLARNTFMKAQLAKC